MKFIVLLVAIANFLFSFSCLLVGYCSVGRQIVNVVHFDDRIWLSVLHFLAAVLALFFYFLYKKSGD